MMSPNLCVCWNGVVGLTSHPWCCTEHSGSMHLGTQRIMASREGFAEPSDMEAVTVASSGSSSVYMNPMGGTSVEGNSRKDRRKRRRFDVSAVQRKLDADLAAGEASRTFMFAE